MKSANYSFEVRLNGRQVKEYKHNDNIFIEGRKGSEYSLWFRNHTGRRVLVVCSVDGLSVMNGKAASNKSGGYVCEPYSFVDIPGWRIDNSKVAKFEFRPQGDKDSGPYVEALKAEGFEVDTANQGVIGVMVFPEKLKPWTGNYYKSYAYPAEERARGITCSSSGSMTSWDQVAKGIAPTSTASGPCDWMASGSMQCFNSVEKLSAPAPEEKVGTGFGADHAFQTTQTTFEREKINPDWLGIIIYDTMQGLRKRGVPVDDVAADPVAHAFPGYGDGCHIPYNRKA